MLTKRIIPCLDVTNGKVVKGTHFENLRDAGDPVELAKRYNAEGADELVFLDITASSDHRSTMLDIVRRTAQEMFIPFTVGGGIRSVDDIRDTLNAGADKVSINSSAIKTPALLSEASHKFGAQCIVLALDAKKNTETNPSPMFFTEFPDLPRNLACDGPDSWSVYIHGGRINTGIDAVKWAQWAQNNGAGELLVTSMDADGTKTGYDIALLKAIGQRVRIPVIASGGAGTCQHISEALTVCDAALLASLLHFRELTVNQIKAHCLAQQLPIRWVS